MTGLVRKASLLTFCGLIVAGAAMAGVPSASTSSLPPGNCIRLVGTNGAGVPDPLGTFTITVRDLANNVVPNQPVTLDFIGCTDSHMAVTAVQLAGTTVNNGLKTVTRTTDAVGVVSFTLVGGSNNFGGGGATLHPGSGFGCCVVKAGTVTLGNLGVSAFNADNSGPFVVASINAGDTSLFIGDSFNPGAGATYCYRSNINCSSEASPTNAADTSFEIGVTFGAYTFGYSGANTAW